jgi:hypothetical protein
MSASVTTASATTVARGITPLVMSRIVEITYMRFGASRVTSRGVALAKPTAASPKMPDALRAREVRDGMASDAKILRVRFLPYRKRVH